MSTPAPTEHLVDALTLEGDAICDLWEIRLKGVNQIYRFWNGIERTWQGNLYEGLACQLRGETRSSDGSQSRPTLLIQNPDNIFGAFVAEGYFDLAELIRKRVLQTHLIQDVNIFQQHIWLVSRPTAVNRTTLSLELRRPTDTPAWKTPRRAFTADAYPFVTI